MLLVDVSASGGFGSVEQSKRELAAEVASLLAFSAIGNRDKVGLVALLRGGRAFPAAAQGPGARFAAHPRGALSPAARAAHEHRGGAGVSQPSGFPAVRRLPVLGFPGTGFFPAVGGHVPTARSGRGAVWSIRWRKPLPDVGRISLEDAETGAVYEINTSDRRVRSGFRTGRGRPAADARRAVAARPRGQHYPPHECRLPPGVCAPFSCNASAALPADDLALLLPLAAVAASTPSLLGCAPGYQGPSCRRSRFTIAAGGVWFVIAGACPGARRRWCSGSGCGVRKRLYGGSDVHTPGRWPRDVCRNWRRRCTTLDARGVRQRRGRRAARLHWRTIRPATRSARPRKNFSDRSRVRARFPRSSTRC